MEFSNAAFLFFSRSNWVPGTERFNASPAARSRCVLRVVDMIWHSRHVLQVVEVALRSCTARSG
eukprot:1825001-Amphidinium_carterae.1